MDETLTGGYRRPDPLSLPIGKPGQRNSGLARFDDPQAATGQHNALLRALIGLEEGAFDFFQNPGTGTLGTTLNRAGAGVREMITQAIISLRGRPYQGGTHREAIEAAARALGKTADEVEMMLSPDDYGFRTSLGRTLSRNEAAHVAHEAGQIQRDPTNLQLISEDLLLPHTPNSAYTRARPDPFSEFMTMDAEQQALARLLAAGTTKAQDNIPPGATRSHFWPGFGSPSMSGTDAPASHTMIPLNFTPRFGSQVPPTRETGVSYDIVGGQGRNHPSRFSTAFRINSFDPRTESIIGRLSNMTTLTPANGLTPTQQYNLALMGQLLGEK